jgi:hypothetical protein
MVATDVLLLLQESPAVVASVNVAAVPAHAVETPDIAAGKAFTVTEDVR